MVLIDSAVETIVLLGYISAVILGGGFLIAWIERVSDSNLYVSFGKAGYLITCIGVFIHEFSHLIAVLIMFMKPTEVKFFRPIKGLKDGTLGYVNYKYNKNNRIHRMGLIFVGIAPVIGGILAMAIFLRVLLPDVYMFLYEELLGLVSSGNLLGVELFQSGFEVIIRFMMRLFAGDNLSRLSFWLFLFLILSVSSHMSLSKADIMSAICGIPSFYMFVFFLNLLLKGFGYNFGNVVSLINVFLVYIVVFVFMGILFSIVSLMITGVLRVLFQR